MLVLLVPVLVGACGGEGDVATTTETSTPQGFFVSGLVHAGPVCPVVTDPPDPACADRPVEDAVILVEDSAGVVVSTIGTGVDGTFIVILPPGAYTFVPQPVEGLMGTASEQDVLVVDGPVDGLDFAYDTGIR